MYNYSMKVSIIIPIYNAENHLHKCIGSVVSQTYGDLEIILINDGSTDGSESICRSYEEKDTRIKLISQKNAGVSAARNAGLDACTGELITFVDSDDHVSEDYVEYLTDLMGRYDSDIVCSGQNEDPDLLDEPVVIEGPEACLKEYLTSNRIYAAVWGKLYKKHMFDGIRFPSGKRFEDNYVLFRLLDKCNSLTIGQLMKYSYVRNAGSFVNETFSPAQLDIVHAMTAQREFISKKHPSLLPEANARLIYAVNRCLTKMADSNHKDEAFIKRAKPLYKAYFADFLKGPSSRSAKNFCRIARISPKLAMSIYRTFRKDR